MSPDTPIELLAHDDGDPQRAADGAPEHAERTRLARAAHDLRNPLNAFATSLAILEAVLEEPDGTVRRTLDSMERSVQEMERRLDELTDEGS